MFIFQTINFTDPFYAPPVVVVTPKQGYMNNYSGVSRSQCNAMTAWVEVSYQCCNAFDKDSLLNLTETVYHLQTIRVKLFKKVVTTH